MKIIMITKHKRNVTPNLITIWTVLIPINKMMKLCATYLGNGGLLSIPNPGTDVLELLAAYRNTMSICYKLKIFINNQTSLKKGQLSLMLFCWKHKIS